MKINATTSTITPNAGTVSEETVKTNNVAFKGLVQKGKDVFTLNRQGPMGRDLFLINAFAFLLGTRLVTSRDSDEKREILIRDVPTILIAVMGVPVIQDLFADKIQKMSGFAFMEKGKQPGIVAPLINKLCKVDKKVVGYGQLKDWYQYNDKLASGFQGFTERLSGQGGNLKKICSFLGDDIKAKIEALDDKFKDKKFNDNKLFSETLFNKSKKSNEALELIKKAFSKEDNKALKQASWMKTSPTLIGLVLTLGLIGMFIPKLNIFITETVNKNKKAQEEQAPNNIEK